MRFSSRMIWMIVCLIMDTKAQHTFDSVTSTTTNITTSASTTTRSSTHTSSSTTTPKTTTSQASASHVVSIPTIPTTSKLKSTPAVKDTDNTDSSAERAVKVGVGVGLGIGLPLIIVIVVLAVIIVRLKQQLREQRLLPLKTNQTTPSKDQLQQKAADAVIQELSDVVVGSPYESLPPRSERTASLHVYQALNHSTKTDI